MWPPDLGPPDTQLTRTGFGSVIEDAEDPQPPLSSDDLCHPSTGIPSGGLGVCCLPRTSLSLTSLGLDLTTLLCPSYKTNGSHVNKTLEDFAAHIDPKHNTHGLNTYPQLSPATTSSASPSHCSASPVLLSTSSSSSSTFFASASPRSGAPGFQISLGKTFQQQQKLLKDYPSIKQEPAEKLRPCKQEPLHFNSQQRQFLHLSPPLQEDRGHLGQDCTRSPLCSPKLPGPPGEDDAGDQQGQPCRWINCSAMYGHQEELVRHIEKAHIDQRKGEEFACFWAGCVRRHKPFNARYKLLIHMRVHSGEKPNKCMFEGCSKPSRVWRTSRFT
ncbi:zinc finger protein GLIS1-like [Lampris incognitus]|uniref:zinc finger protein GLIS1-like n=1 Tax=Lampris incognitus TaxID=2546036 RepID=UPI0024B4F365|nr:zinc finger protein GLIS1-like [Lampris incognitus]